MGGDEGGGEALLIVVNAGSRLGWGMRPRLGVPRCKDRRYIVYKGVGAGTWVGRGGDGGDAGVCRLNALLSSMVVVEPDEQVV